MKEMKKRRVMRARKFHVVPGEFPLDVTLHFGPKRNREKERKKDGNEEKRYDKMSLACPYVPMVDGLTDGVKG